MSTLEQILSLREVGSIADYFFLDRKIEEALAASELQGERTIAVALLASCTTNGFKEALRVECGKQGILPRVYVGGYNQYAQEIFNPESALYASAPELVILFVDTRTLLGEHFFLPYQLSWQQRQGLVEEKFNELTALVQSVKRHCRATVLLHNLEIPTHSPLGILENKQPFGFFETLEALNAKLRDAFMSDPRVWVFDYDRFCARLGKERVWDDKMYYLGDIKVRLELLPVLCREYIGYIKPLLSLTKKCLVLDCDNTLWGGVLGEDGIDGIRLGPTAEGRSFLEFQKHLLGLFQRGVLLALNSKNNSAEVLQALRQHPHMVLREEHFAAMRINWEDKVSNMHSLAEELNIGLESFVFLDDEHINRDMMRTMLPEVTTVLLPEDPALYGKTLQGLHEFNSLAFTPEDTHRTKMVQQERQRKEFHSAATDLQEYLRGLETSVVIECVQPSTIARIAQLTQKTNQFTMTTRRYSEERIKEFVGNPDFFVLSLQAKDRFGDQGTVGALIAQKGTEHWRIDTFLLSCRVIGRGIEKALLGYIVQAARQAGAAILEAEFIPTKKNAPAKEFYEKNGFTPQTGQEAEGQMWEYDLSKRYSYPEYIKVITPGLPSSSYVS